MNIKTSSLGDINLSGLGSLTGYAPGTWYDRGDMGSDGKRRFGNLMTGTALGAAGALSVPVLQYLFPDRFKKFPGQGNRLAIAALLGGMALPWAMPTSMAAEVSRFRDWKDDRNPPKSAKQSNFAMGQYDPTFPLMKSHLAGVVQEEITTGLMTPGAAATFMGNVGANTPTNQPWFTVGDLTRAALGAGAGAVAGNVVGKGVSYFLGLTPKGRKNIRNVGMGLGALINTGKLGL